MVHKYSDFRTKYRISLAKRVADIQLTCDFSTGESQHQYSHSIDFWFIINQKGLQKVDKEVKSLESRLLWTLFQRSNVENIISSPVKGLLGPSRNINGQAPENSLMLDLHFSLASKWTLFLQIFLGPQKSLISNTILYFAP